MRKGIFPHVPRTVKWLIYLTVFSSVGYGYLLTIVAAYLPEVGLSSGQVGAIMGVTGLALVVVAVPIGLLSDRIGRKRILLAGLLVMAPVMLAFGVTTDFTVLILAAMLGGIGEGAYMATWNAMIADMTTLENRDGAFVVSFIVNGVAMSVGAALPFFFPILQDVLNISSAQIHSYTFLLMAVLGIVSPFALSRLLRDYHEHKGPKQGLKRGKNMGRILRFSGCNALIGLGAGLIIPLIPTWLWLRYSIPDTWSGPLLAVSGITIGIATIVSTRLGKRFGSVRAIVLCQGTSTIFMVLIPLMPGATLAAVVFLVRAVLMNMAGPLGDSYMMSIISKEERGLASAVNNIVWRLPNSVTTFFGGALLAAGIYDLPFYLAAMLYIFAIAAFFLMFKDLRPEG